MYSPEYHDSIIDSFIQDKVCQGDKLLYKYFQQVDVQKFRSRLSKFGNVDDDVKTSIQTFITNATRDVIYTIISFLTREMKQYGDVIMSGGEALNVYLDEEKRIITTDIDTKFTPSIKLGTKLLKADDPRMFGYIQLAKLKMWNVLGKLAVRYNNLIVRRVRKLVIGSPLGKLFGISFPKVHQLNRRYTLIKKSKTLGTLTDIELMALDLKVRYYVPSEKKVSTQNIGGVLDIAYMKPGEFGFEVSETKYSTRISSTNPVTLKKTAVPVNLASPRFLLEDIYALQKLNLRPTKKDKDRKRLYVFAKYIVETKSASAKDSIDVLYTKINKAIRSWKNKWNLIGNRPRSTFRPALSKPEFARTLRLDPYAYENVTTVPDRDKVYKQFFYGLKTSTSLKIPGYYPTFSNYRFDIHKGEWVKNSSPLYIHDEATHRPLNIKNFPNVPVQDTLYGYSPARNNWMSEKLVKKAATIPLVGLKIRATK